MHRLLLVDDDPHVLRVLQSVFESSDYDVAAVDTGRGALEAVLELRPDLVVLDVGLPDLSGTEVARRLRESGETVPILMLTALSAEEQVVEGLDSGATAYITKPVRPSEVRAWVRSLLRSAAQPAARRAGGIELDVERRRVRLGSADGDAQLTPTETRVLATLLDAGGATVSREALLRRVWEMDFDPGTLVVEVHLSNLRRKLAEIGGDGLIETVRGEGYRVAPPETV